MFKYLILTSSMIGALMAGEYTIQDKSFSFYEAKKEQFWTTHDIKGISKYLTGTVSEKNGKYEGFIKIDARKFTSDDDMRDAHVREDYLKANAHPYITYKFKVINSISIGTINVNGIDKQVSFPIDITQEGENIVFYGKIRVRYTDFGIKTPSNFILSAHEDLTIGAKLFLKGK